MEKVPQSFQNSTRKEEGKETGKLVGMGFFGVFWVFGVLVGFFGLPSPLPIKEEKLMPIKLRELNKFN